MTLQHLRSSTANKRPDPTAMADGQIALNTAAASPGLFYKDSAGNLVKAGPVHVGSTAPNVSPASGGTAGNSTGESWLDTSGSNPLLKVWNGSSWQTVQPVASGTVVSTADTGSVTSTMIANGTIVDADVNASAAIAGTKISPDFGSQNVTTTGTVTGASLNPTSSTVPTNGVYLPAANSVAISTNGTGRLFVDSSGRVLAGSASALAQGGALVQFNGGSNSGAAATLGLTHSDNSNSGSIQLGALPSSSSNSIGSKIRADGDGNLILDTYYYVGGYQACGLRFNVNSTERMRLDSSGRLGVGTSSPSRELHVTGASHTFIRINAPTNLYPALELTDNNVTTAGQHWQIYKVPTTHSLGFFNGSERMTIDSSGRVGIGTSSPSTILHINTSVNNSSDYYLDAGATALIRNDNASGVTSLRLASSGNSTSALVWGGSGSETLIFANRQNERLRIDSSGRVGIGTTSGDQALSVQGLISTKAPDGVTRGLVGSPSWDASYFAVQNGTLAQSAANAALHQNTVGVTTLNSASGYPLLFTVGQGERARIDSSGRLLVGTSSAGSTYRIGTTSFTPRVQFQGTDVSPLAIQRTDGPSHFFISTGQQVLNNAQIGVLSFNSSDGTNLVQSATIESARDGASSSGSVAGRLVFSTTPDSGSSPVERMRINNQGGSSSFAAGGWDNYVASNSSAAGTSVTFYNGRHSATGTFTGTNSYYVWTNGNVQNTNGSYTAISDAKLKENIVDAGSQWSDLKAIRIRNWNFKAETGHETHRQIGPIAQELETVCPGLVFATPDRDEDGNETGEVTKGVNQSVLYMKAVKALQEAMERIETLEAKVAALEGA